MSPLITDTDRQILHSFATFPFLTVRQVVQLGFSPGAATLASTTLRRLFLMELLQRQALPSQLQAGSVPWIYSLTSLGRSYLRRRGIVCAYPHSPGRLHTLYDYEDLRHDLGVSDLLISGILHARKTPGVRLAQVLHDRTLRAKRRSPVVFDGWVEFLLNEREQQCIAFEYERSIKDAHAFHQKIMALLELLAPIANGKSQYEEQFGTTSVTIAYVTALRETDIVTMKKRIEQVLQACQKEYEADVFRLLSVPFCGIEPGIFEQRVWYRPFTTALVSLGGEK